MRRKSRPARRAAPTTAPMTIPAMAPPDKPLWRLDAAAIDDEEGVDEEVEEDVVAEEVGMLVEKVMYPVMVGSTTPAHLVPAWEL